MSVADVSSQYFTYEGRLASFQHAQPLSKRRTSNVSSKALKSIRWPHSFLPPERMAKAGFFHYPTQENPDNTVCFLCQKSLDGWEENDDPLVEHLRHSPDCGWAIVASIDARDRELSQEYPLSAKMIEARKETFGDRWPHEIKKGWKCKIKQMVDAGWKYTPTPEYDDMATCAYCELALDGWEPSDRPMDEHHNRSPDCPFFVLVSEHEESNGRKKSTKGRKPRMSKASRLSTQSSFTVASEPPLFADLPPEEGDSVLTTATTATLTSQAGTKMAKGKKTGKSRKTKAKKDETVEISVITEPEDADFEVKVEQPRATRGKKRSSEAMLEDSSTIDVQQPAPKRRGTRTARGSAAVAEISLAPSTSGIHADTTMTTVDDTFSEDKRPTAKRGRPSRAKSQRNVSTASVASKAALRMEVPNDDEIERRLQADLERPLSDEEDNGSAGGASKLRRESHSKKSATAASAAPVRKIKRGSKIPNSDYEMFSAEGPSVDEDALNAELEAMEIDEGVPPPKAKGTKGKQTRKPSAKQLAAAKIAVDAMHIDDETPAEDDAETGRHPSPKAAKGRKTGGRATSRMASSRVTRDSALSTDEINTSVAPNLDIHDADNDSDASNASQSTVIRGGPKRRGSKLKKTANGKKTTSRNIEEIIRPMEITSDEQQPQEVPQKKVIGRPRKPVPAKEPDSTEEIQIGVTPTLPGPQEPQPVAKSSKLMPGKAKGKDKVLPDLPLDMKAGTSARNSRAVPESPKRPLKELTPSLSPQSSDAENQPPSSKPSTFKSATQQGQTSRVPLASSTPTIPPSKRNPTTTLQSVHPWTAVDLDNILLKSPSDMRVEKENVTNSLLVEAMGKIKKGELTSPEKRMSVEEWILYNASQAEEKLRGECERMVGLFEREGGRAMSALEGLACVE